MEKNLFGNHPPPAFASDQLVNVNSTGRRDRDGNSLLSVAIDEGYSTVAGPSKLSVTEITEIDGPSSAENYIKTSSPVAVSFILVYCWFPCFYVSFSVH